MNTRNNLPRYWYPFSGPTLHKVVASDICIYGATPAGITAAVQAAKLGKTVALVEFGSRNKNPKNAFFVICVTSHSRTVDYFIS